MSLAMEGLMADLSQRLDGMRVQEVNHYTVPDYLAEDWQQRLNDSSELGTNDTNDGAKSSLSFSETVVSSSQINELWREKICEWYYQIVDHYGTTISYAFPVFAVQYCLYPLVAHLFYLYHIIYPSYCSLFLEFSREVVSISISYLDRYLATRTVNRRVFQLAAMTALYIAIKLYENGHFAISSITALSRGYFIAEHIVAMEEIMLKALKWHVHPPTPIAFCRDFMLLISTDLPPKIRCEIEDLVRYLTELSACDYWFVTRKPSTIAIASFMYAFELLGYQRIESSYQDDFLQRLVDAGFDIASDEDIGQCCDRLRDIFISRRNASDDEDDAEETRGLRVNVVTPDGNAQRARRAESPNSVIDMNQSRTRKRKVLSNFKENVDDQ